MSPFAAAGRQRDDDSGRQMSRQDANAAFALTSFLYGGNASYVEDLYARYANDPAAVEAEWRHFFESLKDGAGAREAAEGPSWKRRDWPRVPRDELTAALDGDWTGVERMVDRKVRAQAQAKG